MLKTLLIVGLGGGIGSIFRYLTSVLTQKHVQSLFPWATFLVNVIDRKSTRLNSSHVRISYAVFCLKKKIIRDRAGNSGAAVRPALSADGWRLLFSDLCVVIRGGGALVALCSSHVDIIWYDRL